MNADIIRGAKKPDQTFTDVIRYIDEEVLYLNQHISSIRTEFYDQIKGLTKQINDQRQQIDSNINNVEKKLEFSNTSDLRLELFGAGCIATGLIFTILPLLFA